MNPCPLTSAATADQCHMWSQRKAVTWALTMRPKCCPNYPSPAPAPASHHKKILRGRRSQYTTGLSKKALQCFPLQFPIPRAPSHIASTTPVPTQYHANAKRYTKWGDGHSPGADHAGVVVPALPKEAPIVSNQLEVQVVGCHLRLPVLNPLQGSLVHEQRCCPCTPLHTCTQAHPRILLSSFWFFFVVV